MQIIVKSTLLLNNPVIVRSLGRLVCGGAEHPLSVRIVKFPATRIFLGRQVIEEGVCLLHLRASRLGGTHGHVTILCCRKVKVVIKKVYRYFAFKMFRQQNGLVDPMEVPLPLACPW